jgi:hypothetical protein
MWLERQQKKNNILWTGTAKKTKFVLHVVVMANKRKEGCS